MKTISWLLLVIAGLVLLSSQQAMAGACTAGRFHFINNIGCDQRNGGAGGTPKAKCPECPGMPRWWITEPYVNLEMSDEPLSYLMSSGKEMSFKWFYDQHFEMPKVDEIPNWFYYIGANLTARSDYYAMARTSGMTNAAWAHSFMVNIEFWDAHWESLWTYNGSMYSPPASPPVFSAGYEALLFRPEGGMNYFYSTNGVASLQDPESQMRLLPLSAYPLTTNTPTVDANGISWGDTNRGFKLIYPDGSQDIFSLTLRANPSANPFGGGGSSSAHAFLTQRIDPQGRMTLVGYEYAVNTNYNSTVVAFGYRVRYVVDPDGRTNTFLYVTNSSIFFDPPALNPWMLSEVDDPYGRKAQFQYKMLLSQSLASQAINYGVFSSIIDAVGLTNTFQYPAALVTNTLYVSCSGGVCPTNIVGIGNSSGWITNLSTPYGNTSYNYFEVPDSDPDSYQKRAIYISEPTGAQQLYYYLHNGSGLMATTAAKPTVPGHTDFDDGTTGITHPTLDYRNTIYWGRRQFTALSSSVLASLPSNLGNAVTNLTANDFKKGRIRNWLWLPDNLSISDALSSERDPSPDAAGTIEDTYRTWYNYAGKPSPEVIGSNPQITCIARLLPDSSSQYTLYNYYASGSPGAGLASDNESTYSMPDNSIAILTNWFGYSTNNIDLLSISNSVGQFVNYSYTNHSITGITNALNQVTTLNWETIITHNLQSIQFPSGRTITFDYYLPAYGIHPFTNAFSSLLKRITFQPEGRVLNIVPTNGLPGIITDDRGLSWTNIWDSLNRLTSTAFPDQTTVSNIYFRLDLAGTKDRLNQWTYYGFDGLQHLTSVTNANNGVSTYSWCGCGSLTSILDALFHSTTLTYDNQGNLLSVLFPDYSSLSYQYDLVERMTNVLDGASRFLQIGYNIQGLPITITGANGQLRKTIYDAVNRPISVTDANLITITNQYDAINELLQRTWPDSIGETYGYSASGLVAYTNRDQQKTYFLRDGARRMLAVTNANQEITQFGYDSLNNVTNLIDGLLHTTVWQYNEYGWLTNKLDGRGSNIVRYAYNPNGWLTNRWTPANGNAGYTYDNVGNLKSIVYPQLTISYAYDAMNRLTNMMDAVGTTAFNYTTAGQLAGEISPWTSDTLSYTYVQGLRTALSLTQPSGSFSQSYAYDGMWRMTNATSLAGSFGYSYGFQPASSLVTGISLPNAANIVNSYDALARLHQTALNNQYGYALDAYTYTPDALGLRTNIVRNVGLSSSIATAAYDNIAQLTSWSATEAGGITRQNEQLGFRYDAAHNLYTRTNGALLQSFNVDNANELTSVTRIGNFTESGATPVPASSVTVNGQPAQTYGDLTFARTNITLLNGNNMLTNIAQNAYGLLVTNTLTVNLPNSVSLYSDYNGSLTNDGDRTFAYDAEGQLTNITLASQWKTEFAYDGLNRLRISKDYGWTGSTWSLTNEVHYIYDGNLIIQERDGSNNPLITYTRGLDLGGGLQKAGGIGGLLARSDASSTNFYHADGNGNVTALMDSSDNIVARYLYNPFGKLLGQWGKLAYANTMQFSSMPQQRGIALYPFRRYEPNLQRWLNRDPIGERGGLNLYGYVGNDPLSWIDPLGLAIYPADFIGPIPTGSSRSPFLSVGPPPGEAWTTGTDSRGPYAQDMSTGTKYYPHPEDAYHWPHYDDSNGNRYPEKCLKPKSNQIRAPYGNQSAQNPWPKPEPTPEPTPTTAPVTEPVVGPELKDPLMEDPFIEIP